jgi:hypothetical protein
MRRLELYDPGLRTVHGEQPSAALASPARELGQSVNAKLCVRHQAVPLSHNFMTVPCGSILQLAA